MEEPTVRKYTKIVVSAVVGVSAGYVTGSVLAANLNPVKARHKVEAVIGSWVIGAMVSERSKKYTDHLVDDAFDVYVKIKAYLNEPDEIEV